MSDFDKPFDQRSSAKNFNPKTEDGGFHELQQQIIDLKNIVMGITMINNGNCQWSGDVKTGFLLTITPTKLTGVCNGDSTITITSTP